MTRIGITYVDCKLSKWNKAALPDNDIDRRSMP